MSTATPRRKGCPFCGNKQLDTTKVYTPTNYSRGDTYDWTGMWAVYCENCMATGPEKGDRTEAIEAWNLATTNKNS